MLTEAYICADLSKSCLEVVDMMYKGVVFKLTHFERNTTKELQEEIIFDAHRALTLLSQEHEGDQKFWKVLLFLRMAYALLGIGRHCRIIKNYHPSNNNLTQANGFLAMIDFKNLDHRKEMFYQFAKARYCQYTRRMSWCRDYLTKAMTLSIIGGYASSKHIEEYGNTIGINLAYVHDLDLVENNTQVLHNPLDKVTGERFNTTTLPQEVSDNPLKHVFPDELLISDEETENRGTNAKNEERDNNSTESKNTGGMFNTTISPKTNTSESRSDYSNSSIALRSSSPLTLSSLDDEMSL